MFGIKDNGYTQRKMQIVKINSSIQTTFRHMFRSCTVKIRFNRCAEHESKNPQLLGRTIRTL